MGILAGVLGPWKYLDPNGPGGPGNPWKCLTAPRPRSGSGPDDHTLNDTQPRYRLWFPNGEPNEDLDPNGDPCWGFQGRGNIPTSKVLSRGWLFQWQEESVGHHRMHPGGLWPQWVSDLVSGSPLLWQQCRSTVSRTVFQMSSGRQLAVESGGFRPPPPMTCTNPYR